MCLFSTQCYLAVRAVVYVSVFLPYQTTVPEGGDCVFVSVFATDMFVGRWCPVVLEVVFWG